MKTLVTAQLSFILNFHSLCSQLVVFKMVYCAAFGCNSSSEQKRKNDVSFYRLPKDETIRKIWISRLKRENLPKDVRICHLHFEEQCFERDLKVSFMIFMFVFLNRETDFSCFCFFNRETI